MTEPTKATGTDGADPSMEEILASIRRILNEDEGGGPPEPDLPPPEPAAEAEDEDVLVLDRSMLVSEADSEAGPGRMPAPVVMAPVVLAPEALAPAVPATPASAAETPAPASQAVPAPAPLAADPAPAALPAIGASLLAPEAAAAAASSVDGLLRALATTRSTQVYRGGPTIEDLVREEIRPLLKEWLDGHLPGLVERLVRTEIERVVGRAIS